MLLCSKDGGIAHARVKTAPEYKPRCPGIDLPKDYPWVFELYDVHYYPENPVIAKDVLPKMDVARNVDKEKLEKSWGVWFRGTTRVTEHDFKLLTRR